MDVSTSVGERASCDADVAVCHGWLTQGVSLPWEKIRGQAFLNKSIPVIAVKMEAFPKQNGVMLCFPTLPLLATPALACFLAFG